MTPYLLTYLPTYSLACLLTYLLAVAASGPALLIHLLTYLRTLNLLTYLLADAACDPSLHAYLRTYFITYSLAHHLTC